MKHQEGKVTVDVSIGKSGILCQFLKAIIFRFFNLWNNVSVYLLGIISRFGIFVVFEKGNISNNLGVN